MRNLRVTLIFFSLVVLRASVSANLILKWLYLNCYVAPNVCPNENITFWLYTNSTRNAPIQLDPLNLQRQHFEVRRPVKILIHGYTGNLESEPNKSVRPALLQYEDVYVISVDYGKVVRDACYFASVHNVPVVSRCLAQLINNLVSQELVANEDIHLIGYSLGAQVAGQTANYVDNKLKRITGLDVAKPLFITAPYNETLDASDADFVDVIHTEIGLVGSLGAVGHVDFYPNFGQNQPGCGAAKSTSTCNHKRSAELYAESISSKQGFWSYYCPSWSKKIFGGCSRRDSNALMGYFVDTSLRGMYFLQTAARPPFAHGPMKHPQNRTQEA